MGAIAVDGSADGTLRACVSVNAEALDAVVADGRGSGWVDFDGAPGNTKNAATAPTVAITATPTTIAPRRDVGGETAFRDVVDATVGATASSRSVVGARSVGADTSTVSNGSDLSTAGRPR